MEKCRDEKPGPDYRLSELKDFRKIGEITAAVFRDQYHVLDPDCSQSWIIQSWLDSDDVTLLEK
jgi:hypothetical protein